MAHEELDTRELGGADPLDRWLPAPAKPWSRFHVRAALGLQPALAPALLFIPLGLLVGPRVVGVLTPSVVAHLDPVLSAAFAVLGVFIGLAWGQRQPPRRVLAAAAIESGLTVVVVASSAWYLLRAWDAPLATPPLLVPLMLGIVASVSSAPASPRGAAPSLAASIADFDDVLPIVLGALVLAYAHPLDFQSALMLGGWTVVFSLLIALAADFLFRSADDAERGAFLVGALALLGGGAAYVGGSALLAGFVAGLVWSRRPAAVAVLNRYLGKLQHPLIVVLLLIAGASLAPTMLVAWLAVPVIVFRLTGKLLGASAAARVVGTAPAASLGAALIAPGILGVAFGLQAAQVAPADGVAVASAAALATLVNELLGLVTMREEHAA